MNKTTLFIIVTGGVLGIAASFASVSFLSDNNPSTNQVSPVVNENLAPPNPLIQDSELLIDDIVSYHISSSLIRKSGIVSEGKNENTKTNDKNKDNTEKDPVPSKQPNPDSKPPKKSDSGTKELSSSTTKNEIKGLVSEYARKYDMPDTWIYGVIRFTSGYDSNHSFIGEDGVKSGGLMNVSHTTALWVLNREGKPNTKPSIFIPRENIYYGSYYLHYLKSKKSDDLHFIFTSYLIGTDGADAIYQKTGSYQTEFSSKVVNYIKAWEKEGK